MTDIHPGPLRAPDRSRRRPVRATAVTMTLLMLGLVTACITPPPVTPDHPFGLTSTLGTGELTLHWHAPSGQTVAGYDLQMAAEGEAWGSLPSTSETSLTLTDLTPRTRYLFRVRAAANGSTPAGLWSPAVTAVYVDLLLPVVRVDTDGRAPILDRENYVPGTVSIEPNGSEYDAYSGGMGIRGRGNSTWVHAKKPFRFKLNTKSPIMGIASEKDWVLLANALDRSQLRTYAAMQASEATDLAYTPTLRYVELVLNGQYNGVYLLTQHNEIGSDRVDITEMEPEDNEGEALTGGYRLEIDARLEENNEPGFRTTRNVPVVVKDPDPTTPQQWNYIRSYVQAFETALFGPNFADPVDGYRKYLHVDSFIDQYLVQELTQNQDAYWSSTFFTKERGDDKFRFGPLWDFDISMGTLNGGSPLEPEGWRARGQGPWPGRMFNDPAFVQEVIDRWDELKPTFEQISDQFVPLGQELRPAIDNDAVRWRYELGVTDTPEFLTGWLDARIAWMDSAFHAVP